MAGGTWRAAVHGVTESDVPERLYFRFHSGVSVYPGLFFYAPLSPLVTTCFSTAVGSCCLDRSLYEFHLLKMHTDICLPRLLCS